MEVMSKTLVANVICFIFETFTRSNENIMEWCLQKHWKTFVCAYNSVGMSVIMRDLNLILGFKFL